MSNSKKRNRDLLALCLIGLFTLIVPIVFAVYYNQKAAANQQSIAENKTEIARLKSQRRKKQAKIYQREENIKDLNKRIKQDTNTLIKSQMVLSSPKRDRVMPLDLDQAERNFTSVITDDLNVDNDRLFYLGKMPLNIKASLPTQFQLKQSQIPVVLHAYNPQGQEVAFDVLSYDADQHKFNALTTYSITYPIPKGKPSDYKSYLKQQKQAKLAQEKADRQNRQKAKAALKKQKKQQAAKAKKNKTKKGH